MQKIYFYHLLSLNKAALFSLYGPLSSTENHTNTVFMNSVRVVFFALPGKLFKATGDVLQLD